MKCDAGHRHVLYIIGMSLAASGCVNEPGALRMNVWPDRTHYGTNDLVRLNIEFTAVDKPVAIERNTDFQLTIMPVACPSEAARADTARYACGGAMMVLSPILIVLLPIRVTAEWGDVTDVAGRYSVIRPGHPARLTVVLCPTSYRHPPNDGDVPPTATQALGARRAKYVAWNQKVYAEFSPDDAKQDISWPESEYEITVRMAPPDGVAPLFWQPYNHPISATSRFNIGAASQ